MSINEALECLETGNVQKAIILFDEELAKNPERSEAYYGKAIALGRMKEIDAAIATCKTLLVKFPTHPQASKLVNELEDAQKAKTRVTYLMDKALADLSSDDAQSAFNKLIEAKALKSPAKNLDYIRAMCFIKMKRMFEARESLREELRYFPQNAEAEQLLKEVNEELVNAEPTKYDDAEFNQLLDVIRPYTMLSIERLYALFTNAKRVCAENLPGNFVECGVAAGGSSALLAYVIKRYSTIPRLLFSCDSFSGMPKATEHDLHDGVSADATGWGTGTCAAPESSLFEICSKLGVQDVLRPIKGYFEETLPLKKDWIGMISLLHLDGDWYSSTLAILNNLYDHVVDKGYFQVDDYGYWEGCKKAIHEFQGTRNLNFTISVIDGTGVWFTKPNFFPVNPSIPKSLIDQFHIDDVINFGIVSQMSPNERFQLYYTMRNLVSPKSGPIRFVEVGSFAGGSLLMTYIGAKRSGHEVQGFAVEPAGEPQFYQIMREVEKEVTHIKKFSNPAALDISEYYKSQKCLADFILIDGDHSYVGVRQDIIDYYPLLKPGGIMLFHDFLPPLNEKNHDFIMFHHGNNEPGIRQACIELMEQEYKAEVIELPLLKPTDPTQTQSHLPLIPEVYSTIRVYRKR